MDLMEEMVSSFWLLVVAGVDIAAIVVCFQKGKTVLGWTGVVGLLPPLTLILGWFPVVGALRTARPSSSWARKRYGPAQMATAQSRFPNDVGAGPPPPPPHADELAEVPPAPPGEGHYADTEHLARRSAIAAFLLRAQEEGVIDPDTHEQLRVLLDGHNVPTTPVGTATTQVPPYPAQPAPPPPARPAPPSPAPAGPARPPPQPTPRQPSPVAVKTSEIWDAVASDVLLHGFAYLGVLLTFVGVLGFLLFAFVDVADTAQPFVELFIVLIFFGWAWALRRQQAVRVADAMDLIGKILLPLILFAGLVDNAPFPPDFEGNGLVVALTVTAVGTAAVYAWIAVRNEASSLRFLISPLLWLGAMTLGFFFKSDETLTSDAITRLVSAQPAMASAAIALTLVAVMWKRDHRFSAPAVTAAVIGLPIVYLLTISLSVAESWAHAWPLVVLGIATMAAVELLASWFGRRELMGTVRPWLLAGVVAPLVPVWDVGWAGLAVAASYAVLAEWAFRNEPDNSAPLALAGTGIAVGAAMSLAEPSATLIGFSALTILAHLHRRDPGAPGNAEGPLTALAAGLPVGIGYGLLGVFDADVAWLVMASVLVSAAAVVRFVRSEDPLWAYGPTLMAWAVALGAVSTWSSGARSEPMTVITLALAAAVVASGPRWPALRLWMAFGLVSGSMAIGFETWDYSPNRQAAVFALLGMSVVAAAFLWRQRPAGHLAAIGHVMSAGALLVYPGREEGAIVVGAWSVGWIISVVGARPGAASFTALLERTVHLAGDPVPGWLTTAVRWTPLLIMVASVPPAILTAASLWGEFAGNRAWSGVAMAAIALVYSTSARLAAHRQPSSRILAIAAIVSSVIGVAVTAPESWPMIFAAASVIAVAAVLSGDLRSPGFVWFAWMMSVLLVMQLGRQAGVSFSRVYLVSLVWGAVMLVGGLAIDEARSGRRSPGEGLRLRWLRHPVLLGAAVVPLSLGPTYSLGAETFGWWSLGGALLYFGVAYLLRIGSVTAPAYGLAVFGLATITPWPLLSHPWRFVVLAVPMVLASWILERRPTAGCAGTSHPSPLPILSAASLSSSRSAIRRRQRRRWPSVRLRSPLAFYAKGASGSKRAICSSLAPQQRPAPAGCHLPWPPPRSAASSVPTSPAARPGSPITGSCRRPPPGSRPGSGRAGRRLNSSLPRQ